MSPITVGERDIGPPERIEQHLRNLASSGIQLRCTVNPAQCLFRVGEVSRSRDLLQLVAVGSFPAVKEDEIVTLYYLAGHEPYRFGQRVIAADPGRGTLLLHFPLVIRSNERRGCRRYALGKREEVRAIMVTGLTDGLGVSGALRDVSLGGAALVADKMVSVSTGREIQLARETLKPGPLALVKFKLPGGVEVESEGALVHLLPEEGGFRAGFRFCKLPPRVAAGLKAFLDAKFR